MEKNTKTRRGGFAVMMGLIGMVKPLLPVMFVAILMGCAGNLMATFITVLGGYGLLKVAGLYEGIGLPVIFTLLAVFAVARGVLRYAEQASNHYIAFKLLARIRHKVFAALRRLAPAKLDGSRKGNLISIITSDIELLEVFYAHTISPIAIAVVTSLFMIVFIGRIHPALGILAFCFYILVGLVIPLVNGKRGGELGQNYRNSFGDLNTCVLDNLYGLEEILQYGQQEERMAQMTARTEHLEQVNEQLKKKENRQRVVTDGVILFAGVVVAAAAGYLAGAGSIAGYEAVIATIAMTSSFGPTAALSALSNNLQHTLASGNRVLDILEEEPVVEDIVEGADTCRGDIRCENVSFSYDSADGEAPSGVLDHFDAVFAENRIHGILGKSGCGKSTLLKLLMRFYETAQGSIHYGGENVNHIKTAALRSSIAYVTQETFLFHDTIENNLRVAKEDATREEIIAAAKKASIHDFIMSLPDGYDTRLAELGDSISGGEKQRIGIARAFLSDAGIIFLDEPTSNIDSLNEGIVLKSLEREKENKTILLVSHRKSTMGIVDDMLAM
ncbi:MAG: ABC transporter ATP-binding protein [Eubacteriales bacterium]|nr:ABC transporter ATP-binding protein [Eubacteriales bacterium]